jgi:hypothetical protein
MAFSRSPITRRSAVALTLSIPTGFAAAATRGDDEARRPERVGAPKDGPGAPEAWWTDLEKEETDATRALLNLADRPAETVRFLKGKMKPLKISAAEVRALLLKLGSQNEKVWRSAFEGLEYFDPRLAIDLETLMDRYKEAPGRQRMVEILSGREAGSLKGKDVQLRKFGGPDDFNFTAENGSWWAERRVDRINTYSWVNPKKKWTRAVRGIVLLEHIGTPDAVAILKDMATGHPDAQPTKVARDALKRLGAPLEPSTSAAREGAREGRPRG